MSEKSIFEPIEDGNTKFPKEFDEEGRPKCPTHNAMLKVSMHEDGGGYWRCGDISCRYGCIQKKR